MTNKQTDEPILSQATIEKINSKPYPLGHYETITMECLRLVGLTRESKRFKKLWEKINAPTKR